MAFVERLLRLEFWLDRWLFECIALELSEDLLIECVATHHNIIDVKFNNNFYRNSTSLSNWSGDSLAANTVPGDLSAVAEEINPITHTS